MLKFTQNNLGWARLSLIEIPFKTKKDLFEHKYFKSFSNRAIFYRFSLRRSVQGVQLLHEYYGGTEYHILGIIEGDVSKLDIPYRK